MEKAKQKTKKLNGKKTWSKVFFVVVVCSIKNISRLVCCMLGPEMHPIYIQTHTHTHNCRFSFSIHNSRQKQQQQQERKQQQKQHFFSNEEIQWMKKSTLVVSEILLLLLPEKTRKMDQHPKK